MMIEFIFITKTEYSLILSFYVEGSIFNNFYNSKFWNIKYFIN